MRIPILLLLAATLELPGQIPLFFIERAASTFAVQTPELRATFTPQSVAFYIRETAIELAFPGANVHPRLAGEEPLSAKANFLIGDQPGGWQTGLATYHGIRYSDLYPDIDLIYRGTLQRMKSEFVVAPEADPSRIHLHFPDADEVGLQPDGSFTVRIGEAEISEEAPVAYQGSQPVGIRFRRIDSKTIGFDLGSYDASQTLTIDPVLAYATYLGGSGLSAVTGLAVDAGSNLYVTGWTEALNFPILGAVQASNQGNVDAFVAKLNAAGSALVYATYIGGRGDDRGAAIAVDSSGQAYVTGSTASTNFPLASPLRSSLGGARDAFALKLNAVGNTLLYSTLLGGSGSDQGTAIAVDSSGSVRIAGDTLSTDFPIQSAAQTALGGKTDVFVTKLTASGTLSFSTYLGGAGDEHAGGVAVDSASNTYVAGGTFSTNFPSVSAIQSANAGGQDAFVTKINTAGTQFLYSTYLGGSGGVAGSSEQANAVAVDGTGAAYVTGVTSSSNFQLAGAFQGLYGGGQDAFVSKINAAGNALTYSTYLGGTSFDWANGVAVDSSGKAYIAGYTLSAGFPMVSTLQPAFGGSYDAFVSELSAAGNQLLFSTLYGGSGADAANAIAVDSGGNIYAGGQTGSLDLALRGAIQSANNGGSIGWLARLSATSGGASGPSADSVSPASGSGNTVVFTAKYSHPLGTSSLTGVSMLVNATAATAFACYVSYSPGSNQFTLFNDTASGGFTVVPGGGSAQNSQCTLNGAASSVSAVGTTLTLTISLTFQPGFTGSKTVYLAASDAASQTGFVSRGAWTVTVTPPQASVDSVSPNSGLGASQSFTFVFSDTQNSLNVTGMAMLFNTSVGFTNACYIVYDRNAGSVALLWDSALGSDAKPLASTAVFQNSQCSIGAATATQTGLSNIVTLAITFKNSFSGQKNIYMFASEGVSNTGWVQKGTFTIAAGGVPVATSVVPSAGTGPNQRFSFTVTDTGGAGFLTGLGVVFASSFSLSNACYVVYDRPVNTVSLIYDNPAGGQSQLTLGSGSSASNTQCILHAANTTVVTGTTTIVVTLDLSFNAGFFGPKNVYLYAAEPGVNSGWVNVGTWTVSGGAPTADFVLPGAGSGLAPTFVASVSDSSAAGNISGIGLLFTTGAPGNISSACYVVLDRIAGTIGLYADDGVTLSTKGIGYSTTLQNTQCAVGSSIVTVAANSVLLTVNLVFRAPAFSGVKSVYLQAFEPSANSGWVARASWTIP